jgi:ParB family chromosome partitioning protein
MIEYKVGSIKMEIKWINITLLRPNSYNPNRLSPEEFKGLVESIQNAGYCEQNPILARPLNGYFEIVDGEHRWRACLELKLRRSQLLLEKWLISRHI